MSNNVQITPGVGDTVAAEDLAGVKYQKIKIIGAEVGSTSMMSVNPDGSIKVSVIGAISATISGSITAIPSGNQSVSGAITAPPGSILATIHPAGSITAIRSDNASVITVIQGSSIIAVASGNQSISGAVTAPPGSIMTTINPAGSVTGVRTDNASVIAIFQNSSIISIIQGSVTAIPTGSQSVSGAVTAPPGSVMATNQIAGSIMAVAILGGGTNSSVLGSVTALQGTNPWTIVHPAASVTSITIPAGSITAVSGTAPAGSIMSVTNPAGSVTAVSAFAPAGSIMSITIPAGSITAVRTDIASVITTQPAGSVMAVATGSVAAFIVGSSSIITIVQASSIAGTYAEDSAHTSADKGLFVMQVRNDTMASITSTDGDYSPIAGGPIGETIIANAPITKWIQGTADLRVVINGNSVIALAAQGASIFTYVTGVQVANMGSASVLVTFAGGLGSILGYTIAPAGGGSNIIYPNALKTGANSAFSASLSGTASVLVSAQGFIAKI